MRKVISSLIALCFLFNAGQAKNTFKVTYVSTDHVYIDGGKVDGLSVGDKFSLSNRKEKTPILEVIFISEHSASCSVLDKSAVFSAGNELLLLQESESKSKQSAVSDRSPNTATSEIPVEFQKKIPAPVKVSGNAALVFYQWLDHSNANLDFTQSTARFNLTADNIFKDNLTLTVRTRGRNDARNKVYDGGAARNSWENRLWELSLTHYHPNSPLMYSLGRVFPRKLGSIGYLDGAFGELRTSRTLSIGIFGGRQPDWLYANMPESITKVGFYGEFKTDKTSEMFFNQAFGFVEELYGGEVNRTFLASSGSVRFERPWGISHNMEIDINSGWRKDRAGYTFTLSNFNLHGYYQISPKVRTSLSYDKRKNYWSFQFRSLPDSLFDTRINQGLRSSLEYSPVRNLWLNGALGYRKHDQSSDGTMNYSAGARWSKIMNRGFSLSTFVSGFDGQFEHGFNYRIGLDLDAGKFGSLNLGLSSYVYSIDGQNETRSSRSIEIGCFKDFSKNYYLGSVVHSDSGDDIDGLRLQFEFGVRY